MRTVPKRKKSRVREVDLPEQDENFYFIAGWTEGGYPFGVTWEEAEAQGLLEEGEGPFGSGDEDLPF